MARPKVIMQAPGNVTASRPVRVRSSTSKSLRGDSEAYAAGTASEINDLVVNTYGGGLTGAGMHLAEMCMSADPEVAEAALQELTDGWEDDGEAYYGSPIIGSDYY